MKEVASFTDDAALERVLQELQGNVSDAIDAAIAGSVPLPSLSFSTAGKSAVPVRPGEIRVVDGGAEVLLATPRSADNGRTVTIIQRSAGTVTIRPISATVNGAATKSLVAIQRYELLIANGAYWGAP